jgi:hypothetical protein
MRRKILVPALIEPTKIPLEFRRLQAADLSQWQGEPSDPELEKLFRSIQANISSMGEAMTEAKPMPTVRPVASRRVESVASINSDREFFSRRSHGKSLLLAVAGVVVIVALIAGYWVYAERARRIEFERQMARDREEQVERDRRAQEQAAREAALRRAEEERRAAERATQTKAAREPAIRQRPAPIERTQPGGYPYSRQ